jgi:hypothetical protein
MQLTCKLDWAGGWPAPQGIISSMRKTWLGLLAWCAFAAYEDPLNFPIKLNNKLAALEGVVESGDGRPNASSYTVFQD